MRTFRIIYKGLADTLSHLLPYTIASLSFWIALPLIIPGPGAAIALFRVVDPRLTSELDRPNLRQSIQIARKNLKRGWLLALCTLPLLMLLIFNILLVLNATPFRISGSPLGLFVPLWMILLVVGFMGMLSAFAIASLFDQPILAAVRYGILLSAARLPQTLMIAAVLGILLIVCVLFTAPLLLLFPAPVAAIVSRYVLDGFNIPAFDPSAPTDELIGERLIAEEPTVPWWKRFFVRQ